MRILHLATDLGSTATGRRVSLLVPALARGGLEQKLVVLSSQSLFGIADETLLIRPYFDIAGWRKLRYFVKSFEPTVIHAWGQRAAEMLNVISSRAKALKTFDGDETLLTRRIGSRLAVPPVVAPFPAIDRLAARAALGLQRHDRVVLTVDRLDKPDAVKLAVGAMDVLKYTSPDWKLLIVGDGPARSELERYARKLAADDNRVRFLGRVADVSVVIAAADLVWQTRRRGGVHLTLEALSAGRPVLALPNADLSTIPEVATVADAVALASSSKQFFEGTQTPIPIVTILKRSAVEPVVESLRLSYS